MPGFDFGRLKNQKEELSKIARGCMYVVVGERGAGKSGTIGTFDPSKKILVVTLASEDHGADSAKTVARSLYGKDDHISEYRIDRAVGGGTKKPDEVLEELVQLFSDPQTAKYFQVAALDGLTAVDAIVQTSTLVTNADSYSKGKSALYLYRGLFDSFKKFTENGGTFVTTMASESSTDSNGVVVHNPKLRGGASAAVVLGEIPNILFIERIHLDNGEQVVNQHSFVFDRNLQKTRKKILEITGKGKDAIIKSASQTMNFNPRLIHVPSDKLPALCPANFEELAKL
jgi:hypothetical protein